MTPLERAIAAGHPSVYRSGVVDAPPPRDTTSADPDAAASGSTPWSACHATVTSLADAVARLRALKDSKSSLTAAPTGGGVEARPHILGVATSPSRPL